MILLFKFIIINHSLKMLSKFTKTFRMFSIDAKSVPQIFSKDELDSLFKPELKQTLTKQHQTKFTAQDTKQRESYTNTPKSNSKR